MGRRTTRQRPAHRANSADRSHLFGALLIVLAGLAVYANSLSGPFIFDDQEGIVENATIRRLWPLSSVLSPPRNTTVAGRPIANLTFALNYAASGLSTRGYHIVNLAIHLCAGLVLYGVARRTFATKPLHDEYGRAGSGLATAVALLWVVHPLQTESVTYVIQRVESLMGLLYLLTLYALIRHAERPGAGWFILAVVACALGMGTKEVMVTAPLVVLLYDRAFLAGTFREALRRRWGLYAGLAATWVILAWLVAGGPRAVTAGIGVKGVTPLTYATTQLGVITHYIRLSLWPHPLCLDYAWPLVTPARAAIGPGLFIGPLLAATVWAMVRRPAASFLGAWFFLILAPTSSFVTIKDAAFEHRMYLPLAAIVAGVVILAFGAMRRFGGSRVVGVLAVAVIAAALGGATIARNRDYQSALRMWSDVVSERPNNPRAHFGLGVARATLGQLDEALGHYHDALALDPDDARTHNNMAIVFARQGRQQEAIAEYQRALALKPNHASAHNNLGQLMADGGRFEEAIEHFQAAIRSDPNWAGAYKNLGQALSKAGRLAEAAEAYRGALALDPDSANVHNNLAGVLIQLDRAGEAPAHYEAALKIAPMSTLMRTNYAECLLRLGRRAEAIEQYRRVLAANPNDARVRARLDAAEKGGRE